MAALLAVVGPLWAQGAPCDRDLKPPSGNPLGYRLRGDRCEGIYVREVAGSASLAPVSFFESFEEFDPQADRELHLEWPAALPGTVSLRATGLRSKLYYRMDLARPSASASYDWSTDVLAPLGIGKQYLAVIAWTEREVGGERRNIYLPLRMSRKAPAARGDTYRLVLWPGAELVEVYLTLSPVKADGSRGAPLVDGKPLGYGFYPAGRSITAPLAGMKMPGIYLLEIGATLRSGGSTALQFWFYRPGEVK